MHKSTPTPDAAAIVDDQQPDDLIEGYQDLPFTELFDCSERSSALLGFIRAILGPLRRATQGAPPPVLLAPLVGTVHETIPRTRGCLQGIGDFYISAQIILAEFTRTDPLVTVGPVSAPSHHHAVTALGQALIDVISDSVPNLRSLLPHRSRLQSALSAAYPQLVQALQSPVWDIESALAELPARLDIERVHALSTHRRFRFPPRSGRRVTLEAPRELSQQQAATPFSDIILHEKTMSVGRKGYQSTIRLRPQLWRIFVKLVEAGDAVVPTVELAKIGWSEKRSPSPNSVNVTIADLSKALSPLDITVESLRGVGRRLVYTNPPPF